MISLSHYLQGFTTIPSGWPWDFWLSINRICRLKNAAPALLWPVAPSELHGASPASCEPHRKWITPRLFFHNQKIRWKSSKDSEIHLSSNYWPFMTCKSPWVSYATLATHFRGPSQREGSGPTCSWPFERTAYGASEIFGGNATASRKPVMAPRVVRILILTHVYVFHSTSANVTIPHSSVMLSAFFRKTGLFKLEAVKIF